ncbi:putative electron transfer flavo protein beta chain [Tilletiaria anomala UBC 951]|uniref:Probable electron transfer flavoprotein subunit beta n=1 Tax=Tilletiaria anomala (strain ATCC 24038 / CBS 436.72 / UBC 951) TaxID=1037660 RepID=A0A066WNB4_TILAU|nr:putative electron transfer flavo protein beta chain [Tilletiaria anomala UBC 951]KDN52479.1 putative electron transfer flavo protein beta chain [Tilletiaria anomala UBC 951]
MRPTSALHAIRVLVPVKRTIDYSVKIRVASDGKSVDTNAKHAANPFDELSIEEAVRLKEKYKDGISKITVVSIGPPKSADVLRTGLAMGADDAIHVEIPEKDGSLEPLGVSKVLAKIVKEGISTGDSKEEVGLVIAGKQAIDDDASQTGQMLAALLNWPQATFASKLELLGTPDLGQEVQVTREIDGGLGVVKTKFPFVMTTDLRLNEPRYASLPNIMKAKKKPFKKLTLKDLGLENEVKNRLETLKVTEPPKRQGGTKVKDVDMLVSKLKEAGRI